MSIFLLQATTNTNILFGLDKQSITSLGVALIAGLAAFFTATVTASKNAKTARTTAEITATNIRQIEFDKRDYIANGQRRKLSLLLSRSATSLNICRLGNGLDVSLIKRASKEVYDFVITPELASAVENEERMNSVYDALSALELAVELASNYRAIVEQAYEEAVSEGLVDAEYDSMWDAKDLRRMIGFIVPPLETISKYFTIIHDQARAELISNYATEAREYMASLTPKAADVPISPLTWLEASD